MKAIERLWEKDTPLEFSISSKIPSGLGLGSSTALTVATAVSLMQELNEVTTEQIAKESYEIEHAVTGRANPLDASVVAAGGAVLSQESDTGLPVMWRTHTQDRDWHISAVDVPDLIIVFGMTPRKTKSSDILDKVHRFKDKSGFARDIIKDLNGLTDKAVTALKNQDLEQLGYFIDKGHKLLNILGMSTPHLQRMVDAAGRHSYGAKVSAYSGGNAMLAITDKPEKVSEAIEGVGGVALQTKLSRTGVRVV
jgi:mevalonate kinase